VRGRSDRSFARKMMRGEFAPPPASPERRSLLEDLALLSFPAPIKGPTAYFRQTSTANSPALLPGSMSLTPSQISPPVGAVNVVLSPMKIGAPVRKAGSSPFRSNIGSSTSSATTGATSASRNKTANMAFVLISITSRENVTVATYSESSPASSIPTALRETCRGWKKSPEVLGKTT